MKLYLTYLVLIGIILGALAFMSADTTPPYEYDVAESYVIPEQTQAGHQLTVHWKIKVNRICPGTIVRTIVDTKTGIRVSYDPTPAANTLETVDHELNRTFMLPTGIPPGAKWYYSDGDYACNLLQRFYPLHVRTPRLPFTVLPYSP